MSVLFSARELAEIAVQIEKNGIEFYDALARRSKDGKTAAVYDYLAGQEKQHLATFEGMLKGIEVPRVSDSLPGEEPAYVRALAAGRVFVDATVARGAKNDVEAAEIGITAEKDSILLYYELRDLVRGTERQSVDRIIGEEKAHLVELTELKERWGQS